MSSGWVRLLGGELSGRKLRVTKGVRPTEGKVREALFSMWGERLDGSRVLDLFAGSGAVGLEALSRGAAEAVLVEGDRRVHEQLRENSAMIHEGRWRTWQKRLPQGLVDLHARRGLPFDLVFADPPYSFRELESVLIAVEPLLAADGELALETSARTEPPERAGGLVVYDSRKYGECRLTRYRRADTPS